MWNAVDADDPASDAAARARPRMVTSSLGVEETLTLKAASTLSLSLYPSLSLSDLAGDVCTQLPWRMKK